MTAHGVPGRDELGRTRPSPQDAEPQRDELISLTAERPVPDVRLVRVAGDVDLASAPLLEECIAAELASRPRALVIDLSEVRFLGSRGLAVLIDVRTRSNDLAVALHVTGVTGNPAVSRPLQITGMLPRLAVHDSLDRLVEELRRA